MKRGYIRLSRAGPSLEVQKEALRSAGITDFSEFGPVYVDEIPKGRRITGLPERDAAIRSLLPGDELVVASASRLGTSASDVLAAIQRIGAKEAVILDAETGETISWHPDALKVAEYARRAERANRSEITAKMSLKRAESGKLGGAPTKKWKVSQKRAREMWNDPTRSASEVAELVGISVPTLYRRFGERGLPRGVGLK